MVIPLLSSIRTGITQPVSNATGIPEWYFWTGPLGQAVYRIQEAKSGKKKKTKAHKKTNTRRVRRASKDGTRKARASKKKQRSVKAKRR